MWTKVCKYRDPPNHPLISYCELPEENPLASAHSSGAFTLLFYSPFVASFRILPIIEQLADFKVELLECGSREQKQAQRTWEIAHTCKSRTYFCHCQRTALISKDTIPRTAKDGLKLIYGVCEREPDHGWQTSSGSGRLICCAHKEKFQSQNAELRIFAARRFIFALLCGVALKPGATPKDGEFTLGIHT